MGKEKVAICLYTCLLRRFNEENNEETGAHFTPRDAIQLLTRLVFEPVKDNLPKVISLYEPPRVRAICSLKDLNTSHL